MALLQCMSAGLDTSAVPTTIHCDNFIQAQVGGAHDLDRVDTHKEIYDFMSAAAAKVYYTTTFILLLFFMMFHPVRSWILETRLRYHPPNYS